jgi:DNA-binding response OmpR family regulator
MLGETTMFHKQTSILLVDDEAAVRHAYGHFLLGAGYVVGCAEHGQAGFEMFQERWWDIVITDRSMPQMGGEELARKIRAISPRVPLILMTGHLKSDTRVELFDEILTKPFPIGDLLASVARLVEKNSCVPDNQAD